MHALRDLTPAYNEFEKYRMATTYLTEAGFATEIFNFSSVFDPLTEVDKNTPKDELDALIEELRATAAGFYKDYYMPIDKEVAVTMLKAYRDAQPEDFRPEILNEIDKKFKGNVEAYVDYVFNKSIFTSEEKLNKFLDGFKPSKAKAVANDPAFVAYKSMISFYLSEIYPKSSECNAKINNLRRVYMEGQMKMIPEVYPEKRLYPDANFTLRVTYGKVGGFKPKDAVTYGYFTTLDGIMQKENPNIYDYVVTDRLHELYDAKDYGRYADKDGSMHVAFIAGNHTTGGNSGSPILNAEGELLGLNFDRTWEGTMSDLIYDPSICKNISVDIRYVLFLIDKYAGCTRLVDEMTIDE